MRRGSCGRKRTPGNTNKRLNMILPQRGKDGGLYNSDKQESAKHGACEIRLFQSAHTRRKSSERPTSSFPWVESSGRQSVDQGQGSDLCAIASAKQLLGAILCNDKEHRDTPGALCYVITLQKNPHPSLLARERGSNGGLLPLPDRDGWYGRGHSSTKQSEGKAKHRATSQENKR